MKIQNSTLEIRNINILPKSFIPGGLSGTPFEPSKHIR
jgi:hypothetical protein